MQGVDDPLGVTEQDTGEIGPICGLTGKDIPEPFKISRCPLTSDSATDMAVEAARMRLGLL